MNSTALEKLSDGQRDCLRRVLVRKNSKEIALELGVSPHTVDQRLRVAIQALGVTSRFEAARCLAEYENGTPYQSNVYQSSQVAERAASSDGRDIVETTGEGAAETRGRGRKKGDLTQAEPFLAAGSLSLPIPPRGGERHDLNLWVRLGWIIGLASGTALAFGTLLAGTKALADLAIGSS